MFFPVHAMGSTQKWSLNIIVTLNSESLTLSSVSCPAMATLVHISLLVSFLVFSTTYALNLESSISSVDCLSTPHPETCFTSLKLSLSLDLNPTILTLLLQSYNAAISEGLNLDKLFDNADLVEKQRGAVQDCQELHQVTLSVLQKTVSLISSSGPLNIKDAKVYLNAALTNKATCLEGLGSASGPMKISLVNSINSAYAHVSIALSILSNPLLQIGGGISGNRGEFGYDPIKVVTVASDGSGNFTLVQDAINFAPNNSMERTVIRVKEGFYRENVEIPSWKTNIVLIGDGKDVTVISGNRSVGDGWTTFRSATVAVSGEGFLARDIKFENTAGPQKFQAVALRINADFAAIHRCTIDGYQDTLYVHSFRQFYRECDIYGTIDYIFGNSAVVLQKSNIISKLPMPGQFTVITAQSRDSPDEETGISLHSCSISATAELLSSTVRSYLGRPWQNYSRTVVMESYIDDFIEPEGWSIWIGDQGLDTLYYGEYENYGPGSNTDNRVTWAGYHVMDYNDASTFTVSEFIDGEEWLDSTSVPYGDGV